MYKSIKCPKNIFTMRDHMFGVVHVELEDLGFVNLYSSNKLQCMDVHIKTEIHLNNAHFFS